MITPQERIIKKFIFLSDKYHNLSLLFYELSQSLKLKSKQLNTPKEFNKYLESLNLDEDKILNISTDLKNISLNTIQKEVLK